jgi:hypothetical protein
MRKIKWEMNGDSHAVAYESPGHPFKDRPLAFVSVVEPGAMGGVMIAVARYLEAYGTVNPEVRATLGEPAPSGEVERAE